MAESVEEVAVTLEVALASRRSGNREESLRLLRSVAASDARNPRVTVEIATELRELGRLDEAEVAFKQTLEIDPHSISALRGLAFVARQRGDREEAVRLWQIVVETRSEVSTWYQLAEDLRELGRLDEAEAASQRALEIDPRFVPALRGLAFVARQRGDRAKAVRLWRIVAEVRSDVSTWYQLAEDLRELGRLNEAEAALKQALEVDPRYMPALRGLCLAARQRGDREEAARLWRVAAEIRPDASTWHELAYDLRELNRLGDAEAALNQALELDPHFTPALRTLGYLARASGDRETALRYFLSAAGRKPDDFWVASDIAGALRDLGRLSEAETWTLRALALHPTQPHAWVLLAQCTQLRSTPDLALAALRHAVALAPQNETVLLVLGDAYKQRWRLDEAEAVYDAALALNPSNGQTLVQAGELAVRRGQRDRGLALFQQAADLPQFHVAAHLALAREWASRKNFTEAEASLARVVRRSPENLQASLELGRLSRSAGDDRQAVTRFEQVARAHPTLPQPLVEMASSQIRLGDCAGAVRALSQALALQADYLAALFLVAQLAQQSDKFGSAVAIYQRAQDLFPDNTGVSLNLASCFVSLGRVSEAEAIFSSLLDREGDLPNLYTGKANALLATGRYTEARRAADHAVQIAPYDYAAWSTKLRIAIRTGEIETAEAMLADEPLFSQADRDQTTIYAATLDLARWNPQNSLKRLQDVSGATATDTWRHDIASRAAFMQGDWSALEHHLRQNVRASISYRHLRRLPLHISQTHLGQILDEVRLEPEAAVSLGAFAKLAPAAAVEQISDLVGRYPDYTPAAVILFIMLRRAGRLDQAPREGGRGHISQTIAQFWNDEDLPADLVPYCSSWVDMNPGYAYRRFTEKSAAEYLVAHHAPAVVQAFQRAREPAMKADLFRLAYLARDGGYYADADDRCRAPLETLAGPDHDLFLYQEDLGSIGNDILGAVPGHPVLLLALQDATDAILREDTDLVWLSTGPGLITRACARMATEGEGALGRFLSTTLILDNPAFLRVISPHCVAEYKHSERHWSRSSFKRRRSQLAGDLERLFATALGQASET